MGLDCSLIDKRQTIRNTSHMSWFPYCWLLKKTSSLAHWDVNSVVRNIQFLSGIKAKQAALIKNLNSLFPPRKGSKIVSLMSTLLYGAEISGLGRILLTLGH